MLSFNQNTEWLRTFLVLYLVTQWTRAKDDKVKMKVKVTQSCLTFCDPLDCTVHGILQARLLEWVTSPFSRGSSQPRDRTQVSCIAGGFFTSWATREAQKYWSGSLSLLQRIFPTQELKWGLLLCRWILYQLSYQGSPKALKLYIRKIMQVNYSIAWGRNFTVCLKSYLEYLWLLYVTNPSSSLRTGSHSVSLPCLSS